MLGGLLDLPTEEVTGDVVLLRMHQRALYFVTQPRLPDLPVSLYRRTDGRNAIKLLDIPMRPLRVGLCFFEIGLIASWSWLGPELVHQQRPGEDLEDDRHPDAAARTHAVDALPAASAISFVRSPKPARRGPRSRCATVESQRIFVATAARSGVGVTGRQNATSGEEGTSGERADGL